MSSPGIAVTGATSLIGEFLLTRLRGAITPVHAISRRPRADQEPAGSAIHWHVAASTRSLPAVDTVIHLAPLWTLPEIVTKIEFPPLRRLVAFSSMSRFTKLNSANPREREIAQRLADAESWLQSWCRQHAIAWTLFRPTMIYAFGKDKNVTVLQRFLRRYRMLPLLGDGAGLRQPVYADDLAQAALAVLDNSATFNNIYELGGGEVLSFREMAAAITARDGRPLHVLQLPQRIARWAMLLLRQFPGFRHLTPEMLLRTEQDLVCNNDDARRDFGYSPRPFRS